MQAIKKPVSLHYVPNAVDLDLIFTEAFMNLTQPANLTCTCHGTDICGIRTVYPSDGHYTIYSRNLMKCAGEKMTFNMEAAEPLGMTRLTVHVTGLYVPILFSAMTTISLVCCLSIFFCYTMSPRLQVWPGPLEIRKTFFVMSLMMILLAMNSMHLDHIPAHSIQRGPTFCLKSVSCIVQFSLLGVQGWHLAIVANAVSSITNPFRAPQALLPIYSFWVTTVSLITSLIIIIFHEHGYRVSEGVCWVKNANFPNLASSFLVYVPCGITLASGVLVMFLARCKLESKALKITYQDREEALKKLAIIVISFTVYWMLCGAALFAIYIDEGGQTGISQDRNLPNFFATVAGGLGIWDAATWVITHFNEFSFLYSEWGIGGKIIKAKLDQLRKDPVDLSIPLREEFIQQTTKGIKTHLYRRVEGRLKPNPFHRNGALINTEEMENTSEHGSHYQALLDGDPYLNKPGETDFFDLAEIKLIRSRAGSLVSRSIQHPPDEKSQDLPETPETPLESPGEEMVPDTNATDIIPFKAYEWRRFCYLRKLWGIEDKSLLRSLSGDSKDMTKNFSEGASGSFFFFTEDKKYIVKTMSYGELKVLLSILPDYCGHMAENPHSLICRFVGCYSVELFDHVEYFTIMTNVLILPKNYKIHLKFDLKGSRVGRTAKKKKNGKVGTLKDNDFHLPVELSSKRRIEVLSQLNRDSAFLRDHNIMDYSLLLGIHNDTYYPVSTQGALACSGSPKPLHETQEEGGFECLMAYRVRAPGAYHLGIIDILQQWDCSKISERWAKILVRCHWRDRDEMSCVQPILYQERFMRFMSENVFYDYDKSCSPEESNIEVRYSRALLKETEMGSMTIQSKPLETKDCLNSESLRKRGLTVDRV